MHVSSRWCVTAVFGLAALACSDPVPPAAQGAFTAGVRSSSPAPPNKACPAGAAFTYDVPIVSKPADRLTASAYPNSVVDGRGYDGDSASVRCSVKGSSTFSFSGKIALANKGLEISDGTIGADAKGTAQITVIDQMDLSSALTSPSANCTINAARASGNSLQIKGGSMWASFSCEAVESAPSSSCRAEGVFVLENCEQ